VLAAGELLRFEQMLLHLRLALQTAQRGGTLAEWVRARGTAAAAFTLLGDPWAAWRLTAELAGTFQGLADQPRLETTARNNHCSTCLLLARMARAAGDPAAADEALAHAEASLRRMRELLALTRDSRGAAFADVNEADLALQQGGGARAIVLLRDAAEGAVARGLRGHARWLTLLEAEALVSVGDSEQALQRALPLIDQLGEGHGLAMRIRAHEVLHQACNATHEVAAARVHLAQAQALERQQRYCQLQVQSLHLRERLDLEHLYRFR